MGELSFSDRETLEQLLAVRREPIPSGSITLGDLRLEIDIVYRGLFIDDKKRELTGAEFSVLLPLFLNPGVPFSKSQLVSFYNSDAHLEDDIYRLQSEESVKVIVRHLRLKIPELDAYMHNTQQLGYHLGYCLNVPETIEWISQVKARIGSTEVNFAGAFASRDGERLHLNRSEYKILESLLLSPSLGLSNTQLYRAYSGYFDDFIVGCGQTVKVHIYRLRNKLGKDGDNIISINSYGYKIDPAAVEFFPKPASIIDLPFVRTA